MTTETAAAEGHTVPTDEIEKALAIFFQPGDVVELRALVAGRKEVTSGYYDDFDRLAKDAARIDSRGVMSGIYVTLNRPEPALLARRANRYNAGGETTHDHEIARRTHLFFDVDAKRPSGISSTDEQHDYAIQKGEAVRTWLRELGWSGSVLFDSGNGAGIVYDIDLPNNPESTELVKRVFEAVDMVKSDDKAHIDTSVHNAARIFKLPGTMARKGDSTPNMPHRRSRIIAADEDRAVVPMERLRDIARLPDLIAPDTPTNTTTGKAFDVRDFIARHKIGVREEKPFKYGIMFVLDECPFCGHEESRITQNSNGAVGFGCFHNSCQGYKWAELREKFEPGYKEKKTENVAKIEQAEDALRNGHDEQIMAQQEHEKRIEEDAKQGTEGMPVKQWQEYTLADAFAQRDPVPWILDGWIPTEGNSVWYGEPNVGKTLLLQHITLAVAIGRPVFPPRTTTGPAGTEPLSDEKPLTVIKAAVLFVELDQSARITHDRFKFLAEGMGIKPENCADVPVYYYAPEGFDIMDAADRGQLIARIREHNARLVVYDHLRYASGMLDVNKPSEASIIMKMFGQIAKETHVANVILAHDNKSRDYGAQDRLSGSKSVAGGVEVSVYVTRPDEKQDIIELSQTKNRLDVKRNKFVEWAYHKDANKITDSGTFYGVAGEDATEARDSTVKLAIIELIRRKGEVVGKNTLIGEVYERLKQDGIKSGEKAIIRAINELVRDDKIETSTGNRGTLTFGLPGGI